MLVSRSFDVPWEAGLFPAPGQRVLVYTRAEAGEPPEVAAAVEVVPMVEPALAAVLADLRGRGIESVLCEGGPTLQPRAARGGPARRALPHALAGRDGRREPARDRAGRGAARAVPLALRSVATADGELYLRYSV